MEAYRRALAGGIQKPTTVPGARDLAALVARYYISPKFKKLAPSSQYCTGKVMDRIVAEHGHRIVSEMTREHVDFLIGERSATPAAANTYLKRLRVLIRYAIAIGWRDTDPTVGVSKFAEGEYHTWDEGELAAFEARWPLGTRERTAYALALYTGQRRGDVCRMTWADIVDGQMRVTQAKTNTKLRIPIHTALGEALRAWPRNHVTIIVSSRPAQYTVESFGNLMADAISSANLPAHCVLHGLRKAAARRLAEAGCTANQIGAITGHKTLSELERYTKAASQPIMAGDAITKLAARRVGAGENNP